MENKVEPTKQENTVGMNQILKNLSDTLIMNDISDGYHTFGELYEHRIRLYIALHRLAAQSSDMWCGLSERDNFWKSKVQSDGGKMDGWFLLGIGTESGQQITYHLPEKYWDEITWARIYPQAPEFDGHTSQDVLERLKNL